MIMRNTKLHSILALSLTLMVGFVSGFATKSLLPEMVQRQRSCQPLLLRAMFQHTYRPGRLQDTSATLAIR